MKYYDKLLRQLRKAIKSTRPGKHDEGSPVSQGQCSCTQVCVCNGCCWWLWLWTSWSPSIFSEFGTIWLFCVPQHAKNTWLGSNQDESFYTSGIQALHHSVWTAGATMLINKPHFVKFDHCIIVSLWNFRPTLVWVVIHNDWCIWSTLEITDIANFMLWKGGRGSGYLLLKFIDPETNS